MAKKKAALSSMISSGIHHHEAYLRQNLRQECILRIAKNIHNYITIDVPLDNVEENHYIEFSDSFKKNKMSFSQLLMHLTNMFGALENVPEEIKEMVLREIKSSDRSLYNFP